MKYVRSSTLVTLAFISFLTLIASFPNVVSLLMYDADLQREGEFWRAYSAWVAQLNLKHWLLNQWGLVVMAVLLPKLLTRDWVFGFMFVWFSSSIFLQTSSYDNYVGLSGLLYGWLIISAYVSPFYSVWVKSVFIGLLTFKVASENGYAPSFGSDWVGQFINAEVAHLSHMWGLVSGYVVIFSLAALQQYRERLGRQG